MANTQKNTRNVDALIKLCIKKDRKACEILYKEYFPILMPVVRRYIRDAAKAEEILHNAFIKIFKNLKQFKYQGSFEGWMKKVTFHSVSDYIRSTKKYRENTYITDESYWFDRNQNSEENLDYNYYIRLIDQLPEMQRIVFNMYAIDGYKHREIAEMLQIPEGTSKWQLAEARKSLKKTILENKKM